MADPQSPKLPDDAPQDVKDFFECKGDKLVWKPGKVSWLGLPVDPDAKFGPGKTAGSVDLTITIGSPPFGVSFTLPMSVNSNGELTVDTSNLPDLSGISDKLPGKNGVDSSIQNINAWFKKNGKKLKGMVLKGGAITLEKTPLAATPPPSTPPVTPPKDAPKETPKPVAPEPKKEGASNGGCFLLGLLVLGLLAALAIGFVAVGGLNKAPSPTTTTGPSSPAHPTQPVAVATTPTNPPTFSAIPTPILTPSTPSSTTIVSNDGLARLIIPAGAVPNPSEVTITAKGQADLPPELAGQQFEGPFYGLVPPGLTSDDSDPLSWTDQPDLSSLGIDTETSGFPVFESAVRSSQRQWVWLGNLAEMISPDDPNQVTIGGQLNSLGLVFGFGPVDFLRAVAGNVSNGQFTIDIEFEFPKDLPFAQRPVLGATVTTTVKTGVTLGLPVTGPAGNGSQKLDIAGTCTSPGAQNVGVDFTVMNVATDPLMSTLGLPAASVHEFSSFTVTCPN